MDLTFLNDISLEKTVVNTRTSSVDHVPTNGAQLRLFKDGKVFPSAQLVDDHSLEYVAKGLEVGNGYDIIDTTHFPNYPQDNPRLVMVAVASKDSAKVDLFSSVGYNPDGTPKTSVLTQGSGTTGKWLITMLEEVYGEELFPEGVNFVDLVINTEFGLTTPNNIYHLPKRVARGANKGDMTYQRRTDTTLWPLTVLTPTTDEIVEVVDEESFDNIEANDSNIEDSNEQLTEDTVNENEVESLN